MASPHEQEHDVWRSPVIHRHSASVSTSLERVRILAEGSLEEDWAHHGSTSGVSIYSSKRAEPFELAEDEPFDRQLEALRGDGYLSGSWSLCDVLATITSLGARAIWDAARFRGESSEVVQTLNSTDHLAHMFVRGEAIVGHRDSCQVISEHRDANPAVGWMASMSVIDPLIKPNRSEIRAHLNVSGWRLEKVQSAPRPPSPEMASRSRQRTQESIPEELSPVARHQTTPKSARTFDVSEALAKFTHRRSTSAVSSSSQRSSGGLSMSNDDILALRAQPGIILTYVLKTTPHGGTLPTSFKDKLKTAAPLCIATLVRYFMRYGFATYINRADKANVDIMAETFDPKAGRYHLLFRPRLEEARTTSIRFHGATYGDGRFDVSVSSGSWSVEYDVPPDLGNILAEPTHGEGEYFCTLPPPGRPHLTQRFSSMALDTSQLAKATTNDPSRRPGATGGCSLIIKHQTTVPIEVRITRRPDRPGSVAKQMRESAEAFCALDELPPPRRVGSREEVAMHGLEAAKAALRALSINDSMLTPRPLT